MQGRQAMKDAQPRTIRLDEYRAPDFLVDTIELHVELGDEVTRVRSRLALRRNPAATTVDAPLCLDGQQLRLSVLELDGRALLPEEYRYDGEALCIARVRDEFVLQSEIEIQPQHNTALELSLIHI